MLDPTTYYMQRAIWKAYYLIETEGSSYNYGYGSNSILRLAPMWLAHGWQAPYLMSYQSDIMLNAHIKTRWAIALLYQCSLSLH